MDPNDPLTQAIARICCTTCSKRIFPPGQEKSAKYYMREGDLSKFWCSETCFQNHDPQRFTWGMLTALTARLAGRKDNSTDTIKL